MWISICEALYQNISRSCLSLEQFFIQLSKHGNKWAGREQKGGIQKGEHKESKKS